MNEMVNKCYSCDFHRQECTFTLTGESKKRKLSDQPEAVKRYGSILSASNHSSNE